MYIYIPFINTYIQSTKIIAAALIKIFNYNLNIDFSPILKDQVLKIRPCGGSASKFKDGAELEPLVHFNINLLVCYLLRP